MSRGASGRHAATAFAMALACAWPPSSAAQAQGEAAQPGIPRGILDPRLPVIPLEDALEELRRNREAAPALERYDAGDYSEAARLGLEVLARSSERHALRFAVANSLAWTGRSDHAIEQYRALLGTQYADRARLGLANVMRWSGQSDLAEPYYLAVLEREPGNEEARRGLAFAGRELRPSLTARIARTADNQDVRRDELALTYRQWSADRAWRLEAGALLDRNKAPQGDSSARGFHASVWAPRAPLSPRVEASLYDNELHGTQWFGTLQLEPIRDRLRIRAGRVNWARLAFNGGASADALTAATVGVSGEAQLGIGTARGRLDHYDISDGNRLTDGEMQLTPTWQPLPLRLVWFGGVYGRAAQREDPRYWSPKPAYGLAFVGVQRGWYFDRADVTVSVRRGFGFTDTAGNSWSAGLSGRYWIRDDIAIGLEAWAVDAPRPGNYSLYQIAASVQHLW